MTGTIYVNNQ